MQKFVIKHVVKYITRCKYFLLRSTLIPLHDFLMVHFHPTRQHGAEGHLISSFFGLALIYVKPLDHLLLISLELRMLITRMAIPIKWQQFPAYNQVKQNRVSSCHAFNRRLNLGFRNKHVQMLGLKHGVAWMMSRTRPPAAPHTVYATCLMHQTPTSRMAQSRFSNPTL